MNKWMQKAIDTGPPEFKRYAEYVTEAMPEVTLPVLRDMYKHNASVREYQAHHERVEKQWQENWKEKA
jgi:hypothetical protein